MCQAQIGSSVTQPEDWLNDGNTENYLREIIMCTLQVTIGLTFGWLMIQDHKLRCLSHPALLFGNFQMLQTHCHEHPWPERFMIISTTCTRNMGCICVVTTTNIYTCYDWHDSLRYCKVLTWWLRVLQALVKGHNLIQNLKFHLHFIRITDWNVVNPPERGVQKFLHLRLRPLPGSALALHSRKVQQAWLWIFQN